MKGSPIDASCIAAESSDLSRVRSKLRRVLPRGTGTCSNLGALVGSSEKRGQGRAA